MTLPQLRFWRWASVIAGVCLVAYVTMRHLESDKLRADRASLLLERDKSRGLQHEIESLRHLLPSAADMADLKGALARRDQARHAIVLLERAVADKAIPPTAPKTPARQPPADPPWTNAGRASPEAAIETLVWASLSGSVENLKDAFLLSPADEARVASRYASLPESTREGYGSPKEFFATLLAARMAPDLTGYEIRDQREQAGKLEVHLALSTTNPARTGKREIMLTLEQQATGWKVQVPASQVTAVLAMVQ